MRMDMKQKPGDQATNKEHKRKPGKSASVKKAGRDDVSDEAIEITIDVVDLASDIAVARASKAPGPEVFRGKGGTFDGGGASGDYNDAAAPLPGTTENPVDLMPQADSSILTDMGSIFSSAAETVSDAASSIGEAAGSAAEAAGEVAGNVAEALGDILGGLCTSDFTQESIFRPKRGTRAYERALNL